MNDCKKSVSLTWVSGRKDATLSLSHYTMSSNRGYATLRLREKETAEVLRSAPAPELLRSEPLAV